jgi:hypothetical protein
MLSSVVGKVFLHPITKSEYGLIRVPSRPGTFVTLDGVSFEVLAEDGCGNCFTIYKDGTVWFWNHETDELVRLAGSVQEFISHCADPQPMELGPEQVKSVWIDPAFAKSIGKEVPKDGWFKKSSTGK